MKITSFFTKENLIFATRQLFNRKTSKKKSGSEVQLLAEIAAPDYQEKVKFLIKKDLLLRYSAETVENCNEELNFRIWEKVPPVQKDFKKEETAHFHQPTSKLKLNEILSEEKKQEVWKVQIRIPKWFKNPHQKNSQILIAYFELLGDDKSVPLYKLEAACRSIKTFKTNYSQMKIIAEKNHAKVFEENGGLIILWEPVREFVKKEYINFLRRK